MVRVGIVALWTLPLGAQQVALVTLSQLKDQFRPLLIFAPRPLDPQLEVQLGTLEQHAAEVHDRDLAVIALPYQSPSPSRLQLTSLDTAVARHRFDIAPGDFAIILIGKDGGEKLRSNKPLLMSQLVDTIDAMPMRQNEMRIKSH